MSDYRKQKTREERLQRKSSPKEQIHQIRYIPKALHIVWQAAQGWTFASLLLLLVRGILPGVTVYLTGEMVNAMSSLLDNPSNIDILKSTLPIVLGIVLTFLLRELLGDIQSYINAILGEKTQDFMYNQIHEQTTKLDMQFYDSSSYFDILQRGASEAASRPLNLLQSINTLLENTITMLTMIGVLSILDWWIPIILIAGTFPVLVATMKMTRTKQKWRIEKTTDRRRLNYYKKILSDDKSVAELRIFNLGEHFQNTFSNLRKVLREESLAIQRKGLFSKMLSSLFGLIILILMIGWITWNAFQGVINIGDIVMFWQAMSQTRTLLRKVFFSIDLLYNDLIYLEDLFSFLNLQPTVVDPQTPVEVPPGLINSIEIKDITFTYPECESSTINNFSLAIPKGKIVAIVGENGAGKSTLIKLLCRFYDPQEGHITWDGVDIRDMNQSDLRKRITILFQQPLSYLESAADNIRFGDLSKEIPFDQIMKAAKMSGAKDIIENLPDGYETILGKRFGTAELSVGEWQRIALARAFIREAAFIILDEPTSAMDSWTEVEWMKRFRDIADERTALIITHRLG